MKLWIGGEISAEAGDGFRRARGAVEKSINEVIAGKKHALNLDSWDCIAILRDDNDFKERTNYSPEKREMDFRLKIDFDEFSSANDAGRQKMIFEMLERSLILLREKKGVGDVSEIDRLIADIKMLQ